MRCILWQLTIVLSLGCLPATRALAGPFHFDGGTNQGWRWLGFYDNGGLNQIPFHFHNDPAPWFDQINFPNNAFTDPVDGKGTINLGSGGMTIPASPSGSSFVHWDLNSPDLSADADWQSASKFAYDVMGSAATGFSTQYYVQAVVHVRKPDLSESYFTDGAFHPIPAEGQPGFRSWATHVVDVDSLGIPGGSTLLDVNLRFFHQPGDGLDGYTFVDNVTAGSVTSGVDRVWGGTATGHPGADGFLFSNPFNWFGFGVPGPGDRAVFGIPAPNTIMAGLITNRQLAVNTTTILNLNGGIYRIDAATPRTAIVVGESPGQSGVLTLQGGTLESYFGVSSIGNSDGAGGQVIITGGSAWRANDIRVGNAGGGYLVVAGGSLVEADNVAIAQFNSSTAQVVVLGSLDVMDQLEVGRSGQGSLVIADGGAVTSLNGYIGRYTDSGGSITVGSGSSWDNSGSIYVGGGESGARGTGELIVSDALLTAGADVTVWSTGQVELNDGTVTANNLTLEGGNLTGMGSISVDGMLVNAGQISPGSSAGAITVDGSYQQEGSGLLQIDIFGTSDVDGYDSLDVLDDVSLNGILQVQLRDEFTLSDGQEYEIIDVGGSLVGTFAGLPNNSLVDSFGGVNLFIRYDGGDGNDVELFAIGGPVRGDLNGDGAVNGLDVDLFVDHVISGNYHPQADCNWDGAVNGLDVEFFVALVISGGADPAVVPEPSTLVLGVLALLFLVAQHGRNSGSVCHRPAR